jgi:nitrate reductase (NAD(P)H)
LHTTENFVKYDQKWPANMQREGKKRKEEPEKEHEWRRGRGQNITHHDAYATQSSDIMDGGHSMMDGAVTGQEKQKVKYSPQEATLLRLLQKEKLYMEDLQENDGKGTSPAAGDPYRLSIDEADQFTPDNWIPRSSDLKRLTGKHPLNAEPDLTTLFNAGLITPNRLHYVRNHGPVPHLLWETYTIDIENGKMTLSMDELANQFDSINIPIAIACDGNRRKELNMIRRSKGFNWGAGAVSCAYWRGALLCDVLLAAGIPKPDLRYSMPHRYVNFEGADELSEGKYATCISLDYAMDPMNDVILAYEMNDYPLPPDHGYPVRLMIPGYVGGKCVKWLSRIWISEEENDSYYHIYDNRVLPSFIREKDSEFAKTMFTHPSTVCNEQNLNSVIVKPAQGEKLELSDIKEQTYRVEGYAYDGGGHEVQRVEISLDGGETWLYCIRNVSKSASLMCRRLSL